MRTFTKITVTASLIRRFSKKIRMTDTCWEWTARRDENGYGRIRLGSAETDMMLAHRVSWAIHFGEPGQNLVCHSCDNPSCVNPNHLFLGSYSDNNLDMKTKDRHTRGERSGTAKLTESDAISIKRDYASGLGSMKLVAGRYGVSTMHVCRIVNGERWSHLC
jgi:hypothetical protein